MKTKQYERIIDYLRKYGSITQLEALEHLGVMRLSNRIGELKKRGERIRTEMIQVQNRYGEKCRIAKYYLEVKAD